MHSLEDVQTANDGDLFDDAMEDDTSQPLVNTVPPMDQMELENTLDDNTSQPATSTVRIDKRERLHVQQKQVVDKVDKVRPSIERLITGSVSI